MINWIKKQIDPLFPDNKIVANDDNQRWEIQLIGNDKVSAVYLTYDFEDKYGREKAIQLLATYAVECKKSLEND